MKINCICKSNSFFEVDANGIWQVCRDVVIYQGVDRELMHELGESMGYGVLSVIKEEGIH